MTTLDPMTLAPAGPPHTYWGIADGLMPGVRTLADAGPSRALPLAMIAAHALECILKGYLSRSGNDSAVKQSSIRHDLVALWDRAVSAGLSVARTPPSWVSRLGELHNTPYYMRYSTGVHGLVLPPSEPMASELATLLELARAQL